MSLLKVIILAAGSGTRMKSNTPKVLHKVLDKMMVDYVIEAVIEAGADDVNVVIGHYADKVKKSINKPVKFVIQESQLGTAHAVMQAEGCYEEDDDVLIVFGDTPMISADTLKSMYKYHKEINNDITVLSTILENPTGYGRIIRDGEGKFIKSVEHKDATESERSVKEINSGMYCFKGSVLKRTLLKIDNNNMQSEYYLPDTLVVALQDGLKVNAMVLDISEEILGVNTRVQLAEVTQLMIKRINTFHMLNGVTIINPQSTYISKDVEIGIDTIIYPNSTIEGNTKIGYGNVIGTNSKIVDCVIENNNIIEQSTILNSSILSNCKIGPYAYIRPGSSLGNSIKVGNFVEIKNSTIGDYTKVSHLTYIGDAEVGENVNFGCGTVVVNYDGVNKHRSQIKNNAFIGCNTNLIAPVVIEKNAYTAAGSTITKDVPEYALAIARERQKNIDEWVTKNRNKIN